MTQLSLFPKLKLDFRTTSHVDDVIKRLKRTDKRFLWWYGAVLRKSMRRNNRKRKSSSKPGKGPTTWAGDEGLRRIEFEVDLRKSDVTVGVLKYNEKQGGGKAVPGLLEEGGTVQRRYIFKVAAGVSSRRKQSRPGSPSYFVDPPAGVPRKKITIVYSRSAKPRTARYKPRPFVKPAFDKVNETATAKYAAMLKRSGL
jgi:hypothetical protein